MVSWGLIQEGCRRLMLRGLGLTRLAAVRVGSKVAESAKRPADCQCLYLDQEEN
jgi:hypothetical protein